MGTGCTFLRNCLPKDARRFHGVEFVAKTALLRNILESHIEIDERFMILPLPFAKNGFATFVSAYAPTFNSYDDVKDRFIQPY